MSSSMFNVPCDDHFVRQSSNFASHGHPHPATNLCVGEFSFSELAQQYGECCANEVFYEENNCKM